MFIIFIVPAVSFRNDGDFFGAENRLLGVACFSLKADFMKPPKNFRFIN
jgi:hypothetical protein